MGEQRYRILVRMALGLTLAWAAWILYDSGPMGSDSSSQQLAAAGRYLEDGEFEQAQKAFRKAYTEDPHNIGALRGQAQAQMRLGIRQMHAARQLDQSGDKRQADKRQQVARQQLHSALALYDESIEQERAKGVNQTNRRVLGVAYANRGILKDQLGVYQDALDDYREALRLAPEVADGPGLLTRFLRNQSERPPSVADRAHYLSEQLAKPEPERLMRIPDKDARQRAYRLD